MKKDKPTKPAAVPADRLVTLPHASARALVKAALRDGRAPPAAAVAALEKGELEQLQAADKAARDAAAAKAAKGSPQPPTETDDDEEDDAGGEPASAVDTQPTEG